MSDEEEQEEGPLEIALVGDLDEKQTELTESLLDVPFGGECTLYFDSPGGNPYTGISLLTLITLRELDATAIVTGACSSSALWPFAACRRRFVTPYSVLLLHPIKWESEENVQLAEAAEWARHFGQLEKQMDQLLADYLETPLELLAAWMQPGRYVAGAEIVEAGIAEMLELKRPRK